MACIFIIIIKRERKKIHDKYLFVRRGNALVHFFRVREEFIFKVGSLLIPLREITSFCHHPRRHLSFK